MASIVKRGKASYSVVYTVNGKQYWESGFKTETAAKKRKTEIEYQQDRGSFAPPSRHTVSELLKDYVDLYGTKKWAFSTYENNIGLIRNYIDPMIGSMRIKDVTTRRMDEFFTGLKKQKAVQQPGRGEPGLISDKVAYEIFVLLRGAFNQAVTWKYLWENPITKVIRPAYEKKARDIWDIDTAERAASLCEDLNLKACINLALAASMRIGEILGLQWSCVSFGDTNRNFKEAFVRIDDELQRIGIRTAEALQHREMGIKLIFPGIKNNASTMLVLKPPKTKSSIRKVFIPATLAGMLWSLKEHQDRLKETLGDAYQDFDMVIAQDSGRPVEPGLVYEAFSRLIYVHKLPEVGFHSLRHTSATMKLAYSKGNIKAVQGDTGHADASMVTDLYAHMLDSDRKKMAVTVEDLFYKKAVAKDTDDVEMSFYSEISKEQDRDGSMELSDKFIDALIKHCQQNKYSMYKLTGKLYALNLM